MCIINVKVYRSKRSRICSTCHQLIEKGDRYVRMFGMASAGDQPYELFQHPKCLDGIVDRGDSSRVVQALRDAGYTWDMDHLNCINIREKEEAPWTPE